MEKAEEIQLADLQLDSHAAFEKLYVQHRDAFLAFGKRYLQSEEDIVDIYQDAIVALFERVQSGKLTSLQSSVKTYLFSIGKYLMIDKHKDNIKLKTQSDETLSLVAIELEPAQPLREEAEQIAGALAQMGEVCRKILTLFYYRGYDLESIAKDMSYKNSNVVKSHKARCMQRLRALYQKL